MTVSDVFYSFHSEFELNRDIKKRNFQKMYQIISKFVTNTTFMNFPARFSNSHNPTGPVPILPAKFPENHFSRIANIGNE